MNGIATSHICVSMGVEKDNRERTGEVAMQMKQGVGREGEERGGWMLAVTLSVEGMGD